MSTTAQTTTADPVTLDVSATPPVPFGRLVRVELRKALDTRAGRWFVGGILVLTLAVEVIFGLAAPQEAQGFDTALGIAGGTLGYFLPVLLILMVTSEWSQRTGLVTFTLEPQRGRVVRAKLAAGLVLGAALIIIGFGLGALGNLIGGGDWTLTPTVAVNGFIVANLIGIGTGFAIGMLLMNSAAAIVGYFVYTLVLPGAVALLATFQEWFGDLAPWVDFSTAQGSLYTGDAVPTGEEWAQLLVTGTIWLVLPFALGLWRLLRAEPK